MKFRIALTTGMIVLLTGFSALAQGAAPDKKVKSDPPATQQAPMKQTRLEIKGVIQKTLSGYFLIAGDKSLPLKGDALQGAMSDQSVKVVGTMVYPQEGQPALEVEKIIPTP